MMPVRCKFCGCDAIRAESLSIVYFMCDTVFWPDENDWNVSNNCAVKCSAQLVNLRERIKRAVEALDDIAFGAWDEALQNATRILRGNSPKSPDSSPVTADQLATEDYFEAVRQRVPWMTAVEHIEGLIEGYRQCGLMVWQTAEEIRKVHGGEYGKAD